MFEAKKKSLSTVGHKLGWLHTSPQQYEMTEATRDVSIQFEDKTL